MSPTRRVYAVATGAGVPVLVTTLGTALALMQQDALPRPLAVHWRSDVVTGTSPLSSFLIATALEVLLPPVVILALAARMPRSARPTLVATAAGLATVLGLSSYGLLLGQRGVSEAGRAPNPSGAVVGSLLLGIIVAVAVSHGYPSGHRHTRTDPPPPEAVRLPDNSVSPVFTVATRPAGPLLLSYCGVLVVSLLVLALVVQDWWICVVGVGLGVGVLSMLFPVIRLDDGGLRIRGFGALPWLGYRIGELGWAQAVDLPQPPRGLRRVEAGAWSYRVRPGGAVTVHLYDGTTLTFSCPAAGTCAAVLNTLVEQRTVEQGRADGRLTGAP